MLVKYKRVVFAKMKNFLSLTILIFFQFFSSIEHIFLEINLLKKKKQ